MPNPIRIVEELLHTERGWMLCFVGEDQSAWLGRLITDLSREPSSTGDGKRIESGFSYWGVAPTVAWERACTDPTYMVMRESIKSFRGRWDKVRHALPCHSKINYVSLGVGTGHKDIHILQHLTRLSDDGLSYFPVDMSGAMLRFGVQNSVDALRRGTDLVYPIQLDFSSRPNLDELTGLIFQCMGDEPILFSLLGNTIANFTDDTEILKSIAKILRPQDRLLVEAAYTEGLNEPIARRAADEYRRSQKFKTFVTSAILQNTDLPIDLDRVEILPLIEEDRAVSLKVIYKSTQAGEAIMLPDRTSVRFLEGDTIRVYLTRKYSRVGLSSLIDQSGCASFADYYAPFNRDFGIALHMLSSRSGSVFVSYSHGDRDFVNRLHKGLTAHGIRAWTDFVDTEPDARLFDQIESAMKTADKVLLVFSETSKDREWVKAEVRLAFRDLARGHQPKLRVLLLTPAETLQKWQCLDENGVNLAAKVLEFPQEDFTGWQDWNAALLEDRIAHFAKHLRLD